MFCNQKRGGTTLRSNAYRLLVSCEQAPRAQYPLNITYNSIVVRPPSEKLAALTKKRSLRSLSKTPAGCSIHYIRTRVILFLGAKRFFVRDEIPFFWKQPAVSLWLSAVSEAFIRRLEACLQAAKGRLQSSTQVSRSGRRLRVFGYNKYLKDHVGRLVVYT